MRKILSSIFMLGLVFLLLAACSQEPPESSSTSSEQSSEESATENDEDKKTFAFVFKSTGNPYGEKMMEGYKEVLEELGHEVILRAPDQPTVEGQIEIIEQLITQNVDAITISANDENALEPVLKKALDAGIKVLSTDSAVNGESRLVHVEQANPERVGRIQIEAISEMIGGEGQIAILSATSQATNQNIWIEWMKKELEKPEYENIELVKVAYGDDLRDKSVAETEALLQTYPDLKGIIAPTTVGIAAAGKVLTDKGLQGKVALTGLGLPSEMASYIENGVSPWMYLWNPIEVGKVAAYTADALVREEITGEVGESFEAGEFGTKEIVEDGEYSQIMLDDPYRFDKDNIAEWKDVY